MSSLLSPCSHRPASESLPARQRVPWHWPVGSRAVLVGSVIVAALALTIPSEPVSRSGGDGAVLCPDLRLDPNTAPARVLTTLPHVGRTLVQQIVSARADRPFTSLDDARRRVRGLGPVTLRALAPHLSFDVGSPFSAVQPTSPAGRAHAKPRSKGRSRARPETRSGSAPKLAARFPELIPFPDIAMTHNE
jgi:hypothetical protein